VTAAFEQTAVLVYLIVYTPPDDMSPCDLGLRESLRQQDCCLQPSRYLTRYVPLPKSIIQHRGSVCRLLARDSLAA
jgi:hypothetical protein